MGSPFFYCTKEGDPLKKQGKLYRFTIICGIMTAKGPKRGPLFAKINRLGAGKDEEQWN